MWKDRVLFNKKHLYNIATAIFIIVLPILYRFDYYFKELTPSTFLCVILPLLLVFTLVTRKEYTWRRNDLLVSIFFGWVLIRYFTSFVPNDISNDWRSRQLDVTQVRPNDGQNLNETITQPARSTSNN